MDTMKHDAALIRFDGKNFPLWEFQFRTFVQGKRLLPVLLGRKPKPPESDEKAFLDWEAENAQVINWLLGAVDVPTGLSLRRFESASDMWKHLVTTNCQANASCQFELELALSGLAQDDRDVRSYYQEAMHLWTESDLLSASLSATPASAETIAERTRTRTMTFIMKLRRDFEPIWASILHRNITNLDTILAELYREETRLKSQAQVDSQSLGSVEGSAAFATSSYRPQFQSGSDGQGPPAARICHYCREPGHIQPFCKKCNWCNYCKKVGHILSDCRQRARRQSGSSRPSGPPPPAPAFATAERVAPPAGGVAGSSSTAGVSKADLTKLLHEALQVVMSSAFAAGASSCNSRTWLFDSGAFNHMTSHFRSFSSLEPVSRQLQVANGAVLPVTGIGSISEPSLSLSRTLHVPRLVPNLISVGQLADEGCEVRFIDKGCLVQDRMTGRELGQGRKQGRVYVLESLHTRRQPVSEGSPC
ncbi:unnamed protein product [Linum trigynum]|uniref:CCHC-type domain-containing protein n=1 Tax=Linum trigynum TaxID=586398 RepID=A0AAV2E374_9ROSI